MVLYQGFKIVTAKEMADIDRRAIQEFGVPAIQLMENAGKAAAQETLRFIQKQLHLEAPHSRVAIFCGRGNNGGDGLVVGRYLKEAGCNVSVLTMQSKPGTNYGPEVLENLRRAKDAGVSIQPFAENDVHTMLESTDLVIDAVLGTGSSGKPTGEAQAMILAMEESTRPVIAIDIPSGLNPDTGQPSGVYVNAVLTLTLGLPKQGLILDRAKPYVGELKVLDIGFPKELLTA